MEKYLLTGFEVIVIIVAVVFAIIYTVKFFQNRNLNKNDQELYNVEKEENDKKLLKKQENIEKEKEKRNADK